jgi:hypothetical protein
LAIAVAVALRVRVLSTSIGRADGDEAVVALMARAMLHGSHPVFFWHQPYGGTLEPVAVAVLFRVFGSSVATLKAVPVALAVAGALLIWRIGRRTVGAAAPLAGALFLVYPPAFIWWSTKERGFYWVALLFALGVMLMALRIASRLPAVQPWEAAFLGVLVGAGWWTSPQTMFVAAPACVWLAVRARRSLVHCWPAVPGALVGAAPWIGWNVTNHYGSLLQPEAAVRTTYFERLHRFFSRLLPVTLGLRRPFTGTWVFGIAGPVVYGLLLVGCGGFVLFLVRRRDVEVVAGPIGLLLTIAAAYPFLYALPSTSYYVTEPRYGLLLAPVLVLLFASALARRVSKPSVLPMVVVAVASLLAWNTVASTLSAGRASPYALDLAPPALQGLEHVLDTAHVTRVYADYWIAYPLTFDTRNRIIASPLDSVRSQAIAAQVASAPRSTFVVFRDRPRDAALPGALGRQHLAYRRRTNGLFAIYFFTTRVDPAALATVWALPVV